jgi:hypothetical protein
VTTGVDLRLSDRPLHNRRPDVLVFDGDPDELPAGYSLIGAHSGALAVEAPFAVSVDLDALG